MPPLPKAGSCGQFAAQFIAYKLHARPDQTMPVSALDPTTAGLEIASLRRAFVDGSAAAELIDRVLARAAEWDDPALWISRADEATVRRRASALDAAAKADPGAVARLPLFGIPFAVKDNID